ncbi:hypothetical protein CY34DRAFT_772726 [Suillus luteus UH-Slu-Lm8-n1]|uniref:ESCRT-II complex subunit VPS25 n=1 Tax=Suillus luteus UH-Slu-Lm8-n1 TaxID=930992 RepID=A0A0C9ZLE5_9AGAM|nr:hypothetical protein CY34DRAFT_772726 [Suillus luteus UH-Slu-Lm8-n1]
MALSTHTTPSGFLLPSIHSAPPLLHAHSEQPNQYTHAHLTEQWTRLILTYARHKRLFILRIEDAKVPGGDWDEILYNERIKRRIPPSYLSSFMAALVAQNLAVYEPAKQTRAVLLHWRLPEEWADVLHSWATATGQLNTILTFYEISVPSPLSGIPIPLLRRAITVLSHSNRAQIIGVADGKGVRFFVR